MTASEVAVDGGLAQLWRATPGRALHSIIRVWQERDQVELVPFLGAPVLLPVSIGANVKTRSAFDFALPRRCLERAVSVAEPLYR